MGLSVTQGSLYLSMRPWTPCRWLWRVKRGPFFYDDIEWSLLHKKQFSFVRSKNPVYPVGGRSLGSTAERPQYNAPSVTSLSVLFLQQFDGRAQDPGKCLPRCNSLCVCLHIKHLLLSICNYVHITCLRFVAVSGREYLFNSHTGERRWLWKRRTSVLWLSASSQNEEDGM